MSNQLNIHTQAVSKYSFSGAVFIFLIFQQTLYVYRLWLYKECSKSLRPDYEGDGGGILGC